MKLVTEVECFTHPVAEYVIVGTGQDPVARIVTMIIIEGYSSLRNWTSFWCRRAK